LNTDRLMLSCFSGCLLEPKSECKAAKNHVT